MVVLRCMDHAPDDRFEEWVVAVEPVGYPETAVLCAHRSHEDVTPGLVFLTEPEYDLYRLGKRAFNVGGTANRIRVTDEVHKLGRVSLPRPPEPEAVDVPAAGEAAATRSGEAGASRGLKMHVQSYLWSEHWKGELRSHGMTWQSFLSETADVNDAIEEWQAGARTWDALVDEYAAALDAEISHDS